MSALLGLFAQPLFLAGIAAAAIPVAIHLLSRRRAKSIPFPSLRFLRRTSERTSSRRRLEELILLLLRAAALGLAAVALAAPLVPAGGAWFGAETSAVLLLDNSLSMAQNAAGRPAFERAREAAGRVLGALPRGTRWALWLPCGQAEDAPLRRPEVRASEAAKEALAEAVRTDAQADMARTLRACVQALAKETGRGKELYVFSDEQARSWNELKTALAEVERPGRLTVYFHAPAGTGGPNLSVRKLTLRARAPLRGETGRLEAVVANHGRREARTSLALVAQGRTLTRQALTVPANAEQAALLELPFVRAGTLAGFVQIESDRCEPDNRRFFALPVREHADVLLVDGLQAALARDRASFYIAAALRPGAFLPLRPRTVTPGDVRGLDFAAYDAVFWIDAPAPEPETVARLARYVHLGGTLVLMPGEGADADAWNRRLGGPTAAGEGLLPATIGPARAWTMPDEAEMPIRPADTGHPLLAPFAASVQAALRRARMRRGYGLSVEGHPAARVALQLVDENPVVVSKTCGAGQVVLWAAPPRPGWMRLQDRPVFVPLMHAHVYLGLAVTDDPSIPCGGPLPLPAGQALALTVAMPHGGTEEIETVADAEAPPTFAQTWRAGLYGLEFREPELPPASVAVNPAGEEGNLARIDAGVLTEACRRLGQAYRADSAQALLAARRRASTGWHLGGPLLAVVVLLLLAEAIYGAERTRHAAVPAAARG